MLNFRHEEFPHSQQSRARRDLVTEGFSDRGRGERHTSVVEIDEFLEIEKLALGGFGAEVSLFVSGGSDLGFEHEVEGNGGFQDSSGLWVSDVFFLDDASEIISVEIVNLTISNVSK